MMDWQAMGSEREQRIRQIMSGEARDVRAHLLRGVLRAVEPVYSLGARINHALYNTGLKHSHRLPRPVISIGNITTGGTGKTPMVQWLARALLIRGHHPACLLRGYTVGSSSSSDEAALLAQSLKIPVRANPNRVVAAQQLLAEHPEVDVILLDDGFQHRRVKRDLNIVLIDATEPFGYGHVLPRGMLREPLRGLDRADVVILTRSNLVEHQRVVEIMARVHSNNAHALIIRANHRMKSIILGSECVEVETLRDKRIVSFCGIGNPAVFRNDLLRAGAIEAAHFAFPDHHDYSRVDVDLLLAAAKENAAEMLVTTEKDWVKVEPLAAEASIPIARAQVEMEIAEADAQQLLARIESIIPPSASPRERLQGGEPGAGSGR